MRPRKYTVLFALLLVCLGFNAWMYASLVREPAIGPALDGAARANAPLLHTYIVIGRPLVDAVGSSAGEYVADAAYHDAYPAMTALPAAADSLLFSRSLGPLRRTFLVLYWAPPVLLVLGLLAWLFRSRNTHLMGRTRR